MLSNLSKLADRSFIVGFFVPALIFYVLGVIFVVKPVFPEFYSAVIPDETVGGVVINALAVWVLAIALMIANDPLFKLVEGYRWPISRIGWLRGLAEDKFGRLKSEYDALGEQWLQEGDRFPAKLRQRYDEVQQRLVTHFPSRRRILPTRFGNAIRAFEDYPRQVYGADSIPLWLHLSTTFTEEFRDEAEDARTAVNCLLNVFILLIVLACALLAVFFLSFDYSLRIYEVGAFLQSGRYGSLLLATAALGAAWVVYELAIDRVIGWGTVVKAGFDCYLPELAKKLGYDLPKNSCLRRGFWVAVSRRAIYNRTHDIERFETLIARDDDDDR